MGKYAQRASVPTGDGELWASSTDAAALGVEVRHVFAPSRCLYRRSLVPLASFDEDDDKHVGD